MSPITLPRAAAALAALCACLAASPAAARAQGSPAPTTVPASAPAPGAPMSTTARASGPFDVKITPQSQDPAEGSTLGRMSLDKQFHGDLEATSKGEMLTAQAAEGSAVYVAIERVTGTLHGRAGSFALVHQGTMTRGAQQLVITVVPDSGTGQLAGITGRMTIDLSGGKHAYDFEYTLPGMR